MRSLLAGAIAVAVPLSLYAQGPAQTTSIPGAPTCATCRIDVTRLFTVGEIPGAATGRDSRIVRDSSGRYLVVVEPGPRIAIVDSAGRFIRFHEWLSTRADRTARGIIPLIDFGGGVHIFDGATQWHFNDAGSTNDSVTFPSITLPTGYATVGIGGAPASLVIPVASSQPHRVSLRLTPFCCVVDPSTAVRNDSGRVVRDSVVSSTDCRDCTDIVLNVSLGFTKGTLWAASADRYRINLYDGWGSSWPQAIDVAAPWLPTRDSSAYRPGRTLPEAPRITGLWFDQNGCTILMTSAERTALSRTDCERRLWVSGLTIRDARASEEGARYTTVVDVLGATALRNLYSQPTFNVRPRVITRVELPGRVELFGPGLVYQRRALPNGNWALDVIRLSVLDR